MTSFKPNFIANRAEKFVSILSNCATEGITKAQLFRSLGLCLSQCAPPVEQRASVLTGSWKTITTFTHVAEYIPCVEPWAQYTAMNFEVKLLWCVGSDFLFQNFVVSVAGSKQFPWRCTVASEPESCVRKSLFGNVFNNRQSGDAYEVV